jgi:hypothetical protein
VLHLWQFEQEHSLIFHVVHVAGKRMIAQGTDGISRADHSQGVIQGLGMFPFLPLHESPLKREPKVAKWLQKLTVGLDAILPQQEDWFDKGNLCLECSPTRRYRCIEPVVIC